MIGSIRNVHLRRLALVAYVPVFLLAMSVIGVLAAMWEGALGAAEGWREITDGSMRCIRDVWVR